MSQITFGSNVSGSGTNNNTTVTTTGGGSIRASSIAPNDCNVSSPGSDGTSSLNFSPTSNALISTNWDGGVRCWDIQQDPQSGQIRSIPQAQVNHADNKPVLDSCFSADGSTVFTVGCDNAVRMWQLSGSGGMPPNNISQQIGIHDAPIRSVGFLRNSNIVVTGGWDWKLKFWDTRTPTPVGVFDMPERVYSLDVRDNLLVVATAGRHILTYDVTAQPREHSRKESPLKYQSRCVSCFPDGTGYAVGGIEGRVGIQYVQKVAGKDNFAFKCHRQDSNAFSVNAIAFQQQFGTFATVGSDGVINFWDKDNKQRLKVFNAITRTVPCCAFNAQGNLFAYASSYDWSKGSMHVQPGNEIFIHGVLEDEIKPNKGKKSSYKSR